MMPSRLAYSLPLPIISESRSVLHSSAARTAASRADGASRSASQPASDSSRFALSRSVPKPSIHTTPASFSTRSAGLCFRSVSQ
jgi:hypothetical protein